MFCLDFRRAFSVRSLNMNAWFAVILCLLYVGQAQCSCTLRGVDIEGGTYTLTNRLLPPGTLLLYRCPEGYYPFPAIRRQCLHNGKWQPGPDRALPQKCTLVECPSPIKLMNGEVSPHKNKYVLGNETVYECYSGYTLRGPSKRVCLTNGKWSGSTPTCKEDYGSENVCPDPGIPPGASRTGNLFGVDDSVTYRCGAGMSLVGSQKRTCTENGQWTGIEPTCFYKHTYDTPSEVSHAFGGSIKESLTMLQNDNDTQEGRNIRILKSGVLNIYIAMDVSDSINETHFNNMKKAVIRLIDKISSFDVSPNYDITFFSSEIYKVVDILDFFENTAQRSTMKKNISDFEIDHSNSGTDLTKVFQSFLRSMTMIEGKVGPKEFEKQYHVIIVFTDGGYNSGGSPKPTLARIKNLVYLSDIPGEHDKSREEHLDVYMFGVGEDVYEDEMTPLILGTGGRHYFRLQNLELLDEIFDQIIDANDAKGLCGLYRSYNTADEDNSRRKYPWFAFIIIDNKEEVRRCIGSLVSTKHVLTAAHCFKFIDRPQHVTVQIHEYDDKKPIAKKVKTFMSHKKFNIKGRAELNVAEFYDYDVALVELEEEIEFSKVVRPICIPCTVQTRDALRLDKTSTCKDQEDLLLGSDIESLSFLTRATDSSDAPDLVMQKDVHAKLGNAREECIKHALQAPGITATDPTIPVTKNFLCTGGHHPVTDQIACTGDSGGAVFRQYDYRTIQVGLVSWGTRELCKEGGMKKSPIDARDFHVNIFSVLPFLKSIIGDNSRDDYPGYQFLPLGSTY